MQSEAAHQHCLNPLPIGPGKVISEFVVSDEVLWPAKAIMDSISYISMLKKPVQFEASQGFVLTRRHYHWHQS